MYAQLFVRSPLLVLPLISLVIFLVVFASVLVRTLARKAREYDSVARLPFVAEEHDHG